MNAPTGFASVALPLPLATPYTYGIPATLADRIVPGARVVVPVRGRELVGIVTALGVGEPGPGVTVRLILAAPDAEPALAPPLLATAEWMSRYYGAPIGLTLRGMLPRGLWGASRLVLELMPDPPVTGGLAGDLLEWLAAREGEGLLSSAVRTLRKPLWDVVNRLVRIGALQLRCDPVDAEPRPATTRVAVITGEGLTLLERDALFRRAPKQRALYETLERSGGTLAVPHLLREASAGRGALNHLVERGVVVLREAEVHRDPFEGDPGTPPPGPPTVAQQTALVRTLALDPGAGALLFGVTGSGKTLVYLDLVRAALAEGRGAILLVPEISLTPQTVSRLRGAFGNQVAVLHSGLSDGERLDAWRALRRGERRVAVGARSAIFAPVEDPGVIIIDEEHEASYKNGETPRYHARDVAAVRAREEGARLVYGSATPSLELWAAASEGRITRVDLPDRIGTRGMPPVEVVDLRCAPLVPGTGAVPWSVTLDETIHSALERGEQVLLLLNRRGFASWLQCPSCGAVTECPSCSIALTVHRSPEELRCHYCDHRAPMPTACATCGGTVQRQRGVGTQQLEAVVAERFPTARIARMDLDTTGPKWSHHRILGAVGRREVDILLGTQMIAKGIDFPWVTVVGVIDADTSLALPDFRSAERTFQLIAQVGGRAGRGPAGGRVIVQTRQPEHHAIHCASHHDAPGFLAEELSQRRMPPYPPVTSLVHLVISGPVEERVAARAEALAAWLRRMVERHALELDVLGPAACPLARIRDRWRWHVILKGTAPVLGRMVRALSPRIGSERGGVRIQLDRDPVALL